jgi:hypothetical protein
MGTIYWKRHEWKTLASMDADSRCRPYGYHALGSHPLDAEDKKAMVLRCLNRSLHFALLHHLH